MTDTMENKTKPETVQTTGAAAENASPAVTIQNIEGALEAILFAAGHPMAYAKLAEVLGLGVKDVKKLLSHMSEAYGDRGIQLLFFPDTCQLATKEEYLPYIREALGIKKGGNLSASSMEVLAIVAYNQPVTRSYVDTVRGVDSSYAVNSLLDKGLIAAGGRLDAPGRPMLYNTTDKFLRVFGLSSLEDLPATEALSVAAETAREAAAPENADNEASGDAVVVPGE